MAQKFKYGIVSEYSSFANYLTIGNSYADVGTWGVRNLKSRQFRFVGATNNLLVNVLGSMDGGATYDIVLEADVAVNAGATVYKNYYPTASVPYCTHIKIQVKPATPSAHGTLSTSYAGASI